MQNCSTPVSRPDYVVYIGRFQPFHNGHKSVLEQAFRIAKKGVVVLIGSAYTARNPKNPFSYGERCTLINSVHFELLNSNQKDTCGKSLAIQPMVDTKYNNAQWIANVNERVRTALASSNREWSDSSPTISLIGLNKDATTEYLNWFPQWGQIDADEYGRGQNYDATSIRELLFKNHSLDYLRGVLPPSVLDSVAEFQKTSWWKDLVDYYNFVVNYKKSWEVAPHPPTFVTVDSVVLQDGHVLLIERKSNPGNGMLALPGGFIGQNERLFEAAIRKLREETRLKVAEKVLRGSLRGEHVFDDPDRSLRGRTITHAFGFVLASAGQLPLVKGSDDAKRAFWCAIPDIDSSLMYEDHNDIIQYFVGSVGRFMGE